MEEVLEVEEAHPILQEVVEEEGVEPHQEVVEEEVVEPDQQVQEEEVVAVGEQSPVLALEEGVAVLH